MCVWKQFGSSIVIHVDGITHNIPRGDRRYDLILSLIAKDDLSIVSLVANGAYLKVADRILSAIGGSEDESH